MGRKSKFTLSFLSFALEEDHASLELRFRIWHVWHCSGHGRRVWTPSSISRLACPECQSKKSFSAHPYAEWAETKLSNVFEGGDDTLGSITPMNEEFGWSSPAGWIGQAELLDFQKQLDFQMLPAGEDHPNATARSASCRTHEDENCKPLDQEQDEDDLDEETSSIK